MTMTGINEKDHKKLLIRIKSPGIFLSKPINAHREHQIKVQLPLPSAGFSPREFQNNSGFRFSLIPMDMQKTFHQQNRCCADYFQLDPTFVYSTYIFTNKFKIQTRKFLLLPPENIFLN